MRSPSVGRLPEGCARAAGQGDDSPGSGFRLRATDNYLAARNHSVGPLQIQIPTPKRARLRRPQAGVQAQNEKRIERRGSTLRDRGQELLFFVTAQRFSDVAPLPEHFETARNRRPQAVMR